MQPQTSHAHYTVAVRIRPNFSNSTDVFIAHQNKFIKQYKQKSILTYCFDRVYEPQHNNKFIFEDSVLKTMNHFLNDKINTTFLAYGQTGSGKTYTLFGHQQQNKQQENKGLAQFIASQICSQQNMINKLFSCCFMQVYKQKVTDLINGKQINLRQNNKGQLFLQNQEITQIQSKQQLIKLFHKANSNKIFGNSYVHSQSSRSHVIFTIHMKQKGKQKVIKLNIVDLCGSQVLTYQFDQKQRSQTNAINLSLFTLNAVINDLCSNKANKQNKFIPFRNSVLTRILKSSLINVYKTQVYLFCNISPQKNHRDFSSSTLRFGQIAIQIDENQNYKGQEVVNLSQKKRQQKKVSNIIELNPTPLKKFINFNGKWDIENIKINQNTVKTYKLIKSESGVNILLMHAYGYGCDGTDWEAILPFIMQSLPNCNIFSVDFPGFGASQGNKFTSRAQKFNDKGQPIQFMGQLFKHFKFTPKNKVFLLGYDLGGAISLSCSFHRTLSKSIAGCIVFHPTWTDKIQTLAMINIPVLLLWVPVENFHLISAGTKMSKVIKGALLYKLNIGPYNQEKAAGYYYLYSDTLANTMVDFIKKIKPQQDLQNQKIKRQRGQIMEQQIIFDVNEEEEKLLKINENVMQFYKMIENKNYKSIYQALTKGGQNKPKAVRFTSQLPVLDVQAMNWETLIKYKVIQQGGQPLNTINFDKLPMLAANRQVQVKTRINLNVLQGKQAYLSYVEKGNKKINGQIGITHRAYVSSKQTQDQILQKGQVKVIVDRFDGNKQQILVSLDDIVYLNSPTIFRKSQALQNTLMFQDSVTCKYTSKFVKLKMLQCFYAIKDLIPKMDFSKNNKELLDLQKQCTKRIYFLIDLKHLVHQGIDKTRFTGIDAGRLAYYGQGNCHHLASVTAAFFLPFGKLLGWQVIFRAGSFFKTGGQIDQNGNPLPGWDGRPNVKVEDHTWLQVLYKPSYHLTVFDPSFATCSEPVNQVYTLRGKMHISQKNQCGSIKPQVPQILYNQQVYSLQ